MYYGSFAINWILVQFSTRENINKQNQIIQCLDPFLTSYEHSTRKEYAATSSMVIRDDRGVNDRTMRRRIVPRMHSLPRPLHTEASVDVTTTNNSIRSFYF